MAQTVRMISINPSSIQGWPCPITPDSRPAFRNFNKKLDWNPRMAHATAQRRVRRTPRRTRSGDRFPGQAYENTGLDFGRKRAMFLSLVWSFLRVDAYAADGLMQWARFAANKQFAQRTKDFQKP